MVNVGWRIFPPGKGPAYITNCLPSPMPVTGNWALVACISRPKILVKQVGAGAIVNERGEVVDLIQAQQPGGTASVPAHWFPAARFLRTMLYQ